MARVFSEADFADTQVPSATITTQPRVFSESDFTPVAPLTGGETFAGGMINLLNHMPLIPGDEIVAGGNALIDALQGKGLSDSYDQRLTQARNLDTRYGKEHPISSALNNAMALFAPLPGTRISALPEELLPTTASLSERLGAKITPSFLTSSSEAALPELFSKTRGLLPASGNILKGALLGGAYSGTGGFLSADGGFENRLKAAIDSSETGTVLGGGLSSLGEVAQGVGNTLSDWAPGLNRASTGARQGDYAKTASQLNTIELPEGDLQTLTKSSLDDLLNKGVLGNSRNPSSMFKNAAANESDLVNQIGSIVSNYDKAGNAPVNPTFDNALKYLEDGKVPADKIDSYLGRLGKLQSEINSEGKGSLSYLQQQKVAQGKLYDINDTTLNGFNRAIYQDLKSTIENVVPEVSPINAELQKYKIINPILQRGISADEAVNPLKSFMQNIRTSGGFGTVGAGIGGAIGGIPGAIAGTALAGIGGSALTSPSGQKLLSVLAQKGGSLAPLGSKIEFISPLISALSGQTSSSPRSAVLNGNHKLSYIPQGGLKLTSSSSNPVPTASASQVNNLVSKAPPLAQAIIYTENATLDPNAKNPSSSATGLGQFVDATSKSLKIDPTDPKQSVEAVTKLSNYLFDKYKDKEIAALAYHDGETETDNNIRILKSRGLPITIKNLKPLLKSKESRNYSDLVMNNLNKIKEYS